MVENNNRNSLSTLNNRDSLNKLLDDMSKDIKTVKEAFKGYTKYKKIKLTYGGNNTNYSIFSYKLYNLVDDRLIRRSGEELLYNLMIILYLDFEIHFDKSKDLDLVKLKKKCSNVKDKKHYNENDDESFYVFKHNQKLKYMFEHNQKIKYIFDFIYSHFDDIHYDLIINCIINHVEYYQSYYNKLYRENIL